MNQQTIYFLQALWDNDVQRETLQKIAKDASQYEINRLLEGVLDSRTIWVSDEAKKLKKQIENVKREIENISRPYHLIGLNKEYQRIMGEIQALQIQTAQSLYANVMRFEDIHIVVRQFFPFTLKKMQEQTYYQLYRLLILNGALPEIKFYLPVGDFLEEWIYFYQNKLLPMFEQLEDKTLDGRWAYERKKVVLNNKIQIEQFVAVKPKQEEFKNGIGRPVIGTGDNGHLRIFGRGYITNLTPWDMKHITHLSCENKITFVKDYSFIKDENVNPSYILDKIFGHKKYMITSEVYFEFLNTYIIANTFYKRMELGNCLYCGSTLYHNVCPKCGI
ncbi:MAG: hypothetical protein IKJ01_09145 [Lachnospiraceae bacterium]|nr:hypothetical protein [Lachnospiraceae bacterium]